MIDSPPLAGGSQFPLSLTTTSERGCFGKVGLAFLEMFFTEKLLSSRRVACGRDERGGERQRGNGKNRKSNCANGSCSRVLVIF